MMSETSRSKHESKSKINDGFSTIVAPSMNDLHRLPADVNFAENVFLLASSGPIRFCNRSRQAQENGAVVAPSCTFTPKRCNSNNDLVPSSEAVADQQQDHYPRNHAIVLLSEKCQVIKCGEERKLQISSIHSKNPKNERSFSSIVVSIVYHGSYVTTTSESTTAIVRSSNDITVSSYKPGRLSASLHSFGGALEVEIDNDVDYPDSDQCNNTSNTLGKVVLCYRPKTKLVVPCCCLFGRILDNSEKFEVKLKGFAAPQTNYSITAVAVDECHTISKVAQEVSTFIQAQKSVVSIGRQEAALLQEEETLLERKLGLLSKILLVDCHSQRLRCELDMKKLKENENNEPLTFSITGETKALEMEYTHWCRLIALRTQESNRLKALIRSLISRQEEVREEELVILLSMNKLSCDLSCIESVLLLHKGGHQHDKVLVPVSIDERISGTSLSEYINNETTADKVVDTKQTWDPHLAQYTRARLPSKWTLKDREWITIDRILNPELWDKRKRFSSITRMETSDDEFDKNRVSLGAQLMISLKRADVKSGIRTNAFVKRERPLGKWKCPFTTREQIIAIWNNINFDKMNLDEKRCHRLLVDYNGQYSAYCSSTFQDKQKLQQQHQRLSYGNKWEYNSDAVGSSIVSSSSSSLGALECERWRSCRLLSSELDKAINCNSPYMECSLLHAVPQRFPTQTLIIELERELDRVLLALLYSKENETSFFSAIKGLDVDQVELLENNKMIQRRLVAADQKEESSKINSRNKACRACKKMQCQWKPFVNMDEFNQRKNVLLEELLSVQQQPNLSILDSKVALSARNGGTTTFDRKVLLHELESEIFDLERQIRFERVDKELHDCLASTDTFVKIEALHGYKSLLSTSSAIVALEREHNKLAANAAALDVIDGILNWMLEGWYFGERSTVTSFKSASTEQRYDDKHITAAATLPKSKLMEKVSMADKKSDLELNAQSLKVGMFLTTFMYFRALYLLKNQKATWAGKIDESNSTTTITAERQRMITESMNIKSRESLFHSFSEKSKSGGEKNRKRKEKERTTAVQQLHERVRRTKKKNLCVTTMQRYCRGRIGRKASHLWKIQLSEWKAINLSSNVAATTIGRNWRGHVGENNMSLLRNLATDYIATLKDEGKKEEEEFWLTHRFAKWRRDQRVARQFEADTS